MISWLKSFEMSPGSLPFRHRKACAHLSRVFLPCHVLTKSAPSLTLDLEAQKERKTPDPWQLFLQRPLRSNRSHRERELDPGTVGTQGLIIGPRDHGGPNIVL